MAFSRTVCGRYEKVQKIYEQKVANAVPQSICTVEVVKVKSISNNKNSTKSIQRFLRHITLKDISLNTRHHFHISFDCISCYYVINDISICQTNKEALVVLNRKVSIKWDSVENHFHLKGQKCALQFCV